MPDIDTFLRASVTDEESKHYIVGAFEKGVTVYRQQMRAINLIYALHQSKVIEVNNGKPLAIIGGGIAGLTASVAAVALGYKVYLFEKKSVLGHLQRGCATRWLHPHNYDWPSTGSESPYAALPFLTWEAGSAANVVDQIMRGFKAVRQTPLGSKNLRVLRGAKVRIAEKRIEFDGNESTITHVNGEWISEDSPFRSSIEEANAIIFCVGYGVERLVENDATTSYWRNDDVSQPMIFTDSKSDEVTFLVSGIGDGGLMDVLRLRITNFNQERLIEEFFSNNDTRIKDRLREIIDEWNNAAAGSQFEDSWLYNKFSAIRDNLETRESFDKIVGEIKKRLREDTHVTLNGKKERNEIFGLDKASLLNSFLVYVLLERDKKLIYQKGFCYVTPPSPKNKLIVKIGRKKATQKHFIFRHGADHDKVLREAGCTNSVNLRHSGDPIRRHIKTSQRLWEAGWWNVNAAKDSVNYGIVRGVRTEFVPMAIVTIATTFVTTLCNIIKPFTEEPFRITLHRFIDIKDEQVFQQIARYAGTKKEIIEGSETEKEVGNWVVGRIWQANIGIAGLACRLGMPVIIERDEQFEEIWKELNMYHDDDTPRPIDPNVRALFACPFFSPPDAREELTRASLILFMDSDQEGIFSNKDLLQIIRSACLGFVQNLENMKKFKEVQFISSHYPGFPVENNNKDKELLGKYAAIHIEDEIFGELQKELRFETIDSFDAKLRD